MAIEKLHHWQRRMHLSPLARRSTITELKFGKLVVI
jgi:hypothetical protein